ncbi:acyltransferase [Weeksellaceae bacterium A-14]
MKRIIGKILSFLDYYKKRSISSYQRSQFFRNKKSTIHPTFRWGEDNHLYLHPEAEFHFAENTEINQANFITVKKGGKLTLGKGTYITRATISCLGEIEIGENCILGEGMKIFDHNHQYTKQPFSVSKTDFNVGKVKIGNNVWTGANVIILKDVTIGDNVILGAGCVIYKDVPANSVIINKQEQKLFSVN